MKRASLLLTFLLVAVSHAVVLADVTITVTNTIDGPVTGLIGANGTMTMRVQGQKARNDMDVMGRTIVMIIDVAGKQTLMLDQTEKTVRRMPLAASGQGDPATSGGLNVQLPKIDVVMERTGRTQQVAGQECAEFNTVMTMDMSQAGGTLSTPEVREAMKDMRMVMKGSTWVSTSSAGASEYIKFQQEARAAGIVPPTALFGGQNAPDPAAQAEGLPCLSEIEISYEGSGPMVEMLKKMGAMKVTGRVTEVSLAPIDPELFIVPAGYAEASVQDPLIRQH
jgi:hypothetical protein